MKVAVYISEEISPSAGGSFSYFDRLVTAIDNHHFNDSIEICFAGRISAQKVKLNRKYVRLSPPLFSTFFKILTRVGLKEIFKLLFKTNIDLCNLRDIARLRENGIDILLFPRQFLGDVDGFPFMTMNWDAAHKSTYLFPEFLEGFSIREKWYRVTIQKALAVIVESEASKTEFAEFFDIPRLKIEVVPLFPGGVVDINLTQNNHLQILKNFQLHEKRFFFYPAQFWAHKNHFNLIIAFDELLKTSGYQDLKLIFTGSDKGNKEYIRSVIKSLNLEDRVVILGFVSNEELYALYKNAVALVMPTFLGPTNMPVLEASVIGTPVICSDLKGHRETCKDGAIYVQPTDVAQWTSAMLSVLDPEINSALRKKATEVMALSEFNIMNAVKKLNEILVKYIPIRKTFY